MTRRIAYALLALLLLSLVAAQGASAATSQQIHRDASDGVIDNDYTLAELRAADASATAEMREYFGWDDAYRQAIARKSNPDVPPVVQPVDSNGNKQIDPEEREAAAKKTTELNKGQKGSVDEECPQDSQPECPDEDARDDNDDTVPVSDDSGDDDDDDGSPLIWLIVGLPVLIVAFGAWRMARRTKGDSTNGSDAA